MLFDTVPLKPFENATLTVCGLVAYEDLKLDPRPAVIVCPGGGYSFRSAREGDPVLLQFAAAGYMTFILNYGVEKEAANYAPLQQAALAVKYVREHAAEYDVLPDRIFVCGFSAGGHLAASIGTLWNSPAVAEVLDGAPAERARPTGTVLCYPVITGGQYSHDGTLHRWCGRNDPTEADRDAFSLEKHVSADTAPAFIWHTFADNAVPVQNSLLYAEALTAAGVPFELHIYPTGKHGLSLCREITAKNHPGYDIPHNAGWVDLAVNWIRDFQ